VFCVKIRTKKEKRRSKLFPFSSSWCCFDSGSHGRRAQVEVVEQESRRRRRSVERATLFHLHLLQFLLTKLLRAGAAAAGSSSAAVAATSLLLLLLLLRCLCSGNGGAPLCSLRGGFQDGGVRGQGVSFCLCGGELGEQARCAGLALEERGKERAGDKKKIG